MPALRPLLTVLALLVALGQGVLPSFAAVADGRLAATSAGGRGDAHVEPAGSDDCHRVHPDACELCRLLTLQGAVGRTPGVPPLRVVRLRAAAPSAAAPRADADTPLSLPRGPPAA